MKLNPPDMNFLTLHIQKGQSIRHLKEGMNDDVFCMSVQRVHQFEILLRRLRGE